MEVVTIWPQNNAAVEKQPVNSISHFLQATIQQTEDAIQYRTQQQMDSREHGYCNVILCTVGITKTCIDLVQFGTFTCSGCQCWAEGITPTPACLKSLDFRGW